MKDADEHHYAILKKMNINYIDILILLNCREPKSVAELQRVTKIAYKNLNPHVKKLKELGMLIVKDNGRGKPKELSTNMKDKIVEAFVLLFLKEIEDRKRGLKWKSPDFLKEKNDKENNHN